MGHDFIIIRECHMLGRKDKLRFFLIITMVKSLPHQRYSEEVVMRFSKFHMLSK